MHVDVPVTLKKCLTEIKLKSPRGQWINGMCNECEMGGVIKAMTTFYLCPCYDSVFCVDLQYVGKCCNKTRLYSVWGQKRTLSVAPFTRQMHLLGLQSLPDDISLDGLLLNKTGWQRICFDIPEHRQAEHRLYAMNILMVSWFSIWG